MKIVYQNALWLLFFVAYNYLSLAQEETIKFDMATFFDKENDQAKLAFKTAIDNFNRMQKFVNFSAKNMPVKGKDTFEISNFLCLLTEVKSLEGIICPTTPKEAAIIESVAVNLEVPVIQLNRHSSPEYNNSASINFYPDSKLLFQGLGVIVKNLQWRSTVIFYESAENLIRLQDILKMQKYDAGVRSNSLIVIELGPGPDYRAALKQITNKSEHRIIIDCKTENVLNVLQQAKDLNFLEKQYSYFITSLDAHTLDLDSLGTAANITTVRIFNPESDNFKSILSRWMNYAEQNSIRNVDLNPYSIKTETAITFDAVTMYMKSIKDLVASGVNLEPSSVSCQNYMKKWADGFHIAAVLKDRNYESENLDCITGPIRFDTMGRRTNFTLYVVQGNRDEITATWTPDNAQDSSKNNIRFWKSEEDRNKELERKWTEGIVTVASILGPPYLREKVKPEDSDPLVGNARYEGFSMDLIKELAEELGINFRFEVLKSGARGVYDKETKSWNGLIREVLDRRADLAICDLTITPERRDVVDFSTPFMRLGISILYKKPEPKKANMYAFLDPLSIDLWMYSATLYLVITVVMFFIIRMSPADWENPHPCNDEPEELENIWNMKNCLWLTLGSIMNQGCDILPKGLASRMIASMWWFFAIIVTNSYMANLAAFLTNERSQNEINSAEDLAMQSKVKYGTLSGGSTEGFFRDSNYSVYQRMWTSMQQFKPSVFEKKNEDGVARVQNTKNRGYAFLMESATLEYQLTTNCDLMQVGNWLDSKSYGIAMPLDYPHRSRINEALLLLQERGVINKLKDKWWNSTACPAEVEVASAKLALQNVGGVFIVLAVGIGLSYIAAIGEFLWNVRNISVEEHISFLEALKIEVKFALNVTITKKRVKRQSSESSSQSNSSEGVARSILRGAGSFLQLDILNKGTPGSSRHTSRRTSRHSSRPLD